jgi:hypothetical protein
MFGHQLIKVRVVAGGQLREHDAGHGGNLFLVVKGQGPVVPLITPGDAATTAGGISQSGKVYLAGVACIFLVTVIDVLAQTARCTLFQNVDRKVSAVAAWMRITFW